MELQEKRETIYKNVSLTLEEDRPKRQRRESPERWTSLLRGPFIDYRYPGKDLGPYTTGRDQTMRRVYVYISGPGVFRGLGRSDFESISRLPD